MFQFVHSLYLEKLIKINTDSSISVSEIKTRPFSSRRRFYTVMVLLPEKPINTPHEFDLPREKYKLLYF